MYDFDDYSDWIELYNPGATPYSLNGFFLTDNLADPLKEIELKSISFYFLIFALA